jgi:superfamily II DNA/RNA helicase
MNFDQMNLHSDIVKAITACGYTTPTPIQERSIPEILNGKDLVASAQTGTGKTAAFVLPALHRLTLSKSSKKPRILILTPTRELASQITLAANKYGKFMRFNIISLLGGMPYRQQLRDLSLPVDIIVATPGRLLDHMQNKRVDLSALEMLVLDEADRMLDMGFIDDVKEIAKAASTVDRQTLLFSATVDDKLTGVIRHLLKNPVRIDLSETLMAPKLIKQEAYIADNNQHKERLLQHFLANTNIFKAIIFSGTKINADYLARRLRDMDYPAAALHGDLKQNVRNKTIEQLRRGRVQFLVATDVAARGIDINDVTHVINYDLPKFSEDYVHRIGRTGRAGKTGIAISLVLPMDTRHLQKIEKFIGEKLVFSTIPGLEPTKRMNTSAAAGASKRKGFGGKSHPKRNSPSRGSFAERSDGEGRKRFGGGSDYRKDEGRSFSARSDSRKDSGKSYAPRDRKEEGRSFTQRSEPRREEGRSFTHRKEEGKSFAPHSERSTGKSFAPRGERREEGRSFTPRSERGEGRSFAPRRDEGKSFSPRGERGEGKSFSARGEGRSFTPRRDEGKSFSARSERGEGKSFSARSERGEGKSFSARNERGEGRSFTPRSEGKSFAPRGERTENSKSFSPRGEARPRTGFAAARGENKTAFASRRGEGRNTEFKSYTSKAETPDTKKSETRISFAKAGAGARRTNDKRGNFSRDSVRAVGKDASRRSKPSKYS